jgi:hypothetical protein
MRSAIIGVVALALASTGLSQSTWVGNVSSDWSVSANWSGGVPDDTQNAAVPAGTVNSPSTAGVSNAACLNLTVSAGATLTVDATLPLAVHGSLSVAGTIAGGTVVASGMTSANLNGGGSVANLEIAKTGATTATVTGSFTVAGNLTLTSGQLRVASQSTHVVTVGGNALFQGGVLSVFASAGTLDVAGSVTFAGTTTTGTTPTIRCGGNWTADGSYSPTAGTVRFDGTGVLQAISGTPAFPALTIDPGAQVAASASCAAGGALTVGGTLTLAAGVTLSASANAVIAGSVAGAGALRLVGAAAVSLSGGGSLPNLEIAKTGTTTVTVGSDLSVAGDLTLTSGQFRVASMASDVVSVAGNALFQGGVLSVQASAGTLDVAGNVTFAGTTTTGTTPTIRCGGNWSADAGYAPSTGLVELDGAGPTTVAHAAAGGTMTFATLVLKNGTRSPANDFTIAAANVTINPGASLAVPTGRHLRIHRTGATAVNVNGVLSVAPNGRLSMGPQTTATVNGSGSLSMLGAAGQPATIGGEAGGGYALTVNGTLAANQFSVKDAGSAGMVVSAGAVIADLRNGTFDHRAGAAAGSVLLDVRRLAPMPGFDALVFLNTPGAAGVFNATSPAGGLPISFTNWSGAFGGPSFEKDPAGLVTWNVQAAPPLSSFQVQPGAELAEVTWTTTSDANVVNYQIFRAFSAAGPFALRETQFPGPGYGYVDLPLAANQPVFYALYSLMTQGELLLLGSGSTTPYSSATPGNIKKVGGNGTFATIQAAIAAATDANSIVWVTPGNYDSFTIGATAVPANLRILGDGTGPVNISTANGPIQILNVAAAKGVELSNLTIGSAGTAQSGIMVSNCAGPVVLDELQVSCAAGHTAIAVASSTATAIQRSAISGGVGLDVTNASYVAISRGSLSSLVSTASTIEISTLTPGSVNVTPPSSLITRTGIMPDVDLPEFIPLSLPSGLILDAQPNAPFVIGTSRKLGFQADPLWDMPFLLELADTVQLPMMMTDGLGHAFVPFEVSPIASVLGFTFTVQVVVADPVTFTPRLSNVESMVCVP